MGWYKNVWAGLRWWENYGWLGLVAEMRLDRAFGRNATGLGWWKKWS